jgi:hypothetical protein
VDQEPESRGQMVDQKPEPPRVQIAGDRLLKTVGIDLNKWTVGDRSIPSLGSV